MNAKLIDDLKSDAGFLHTANQLITEVVAQQTNRRCIASDGLVLVAAMIDIGKSISIHFRLHFLDTPSGYGMAPAKLAVAVDPTRDRYLISTLSCGLRQPEGDFWYPVSKRTPVGILPMIIIGPTPGPANTVKRRSRPGSIVVIEEAVNQEMRPSCRSESFGVVVFFWDGVYEIESNERKSHSARIRRFHRTLRSNGRPTI